MRLAWRVLGIIGLAAALASSGCGGKATTPPAPPVAQKPTLPLPEWAPKNPSPEFLRAAKVLKPLPLDFMKSPESSAAENAARMKAAAIMWPAAYEFFGTLSDKQIERFLQAKPKYVAIPIKQLTQEQRAALDAYFEAWRQAYKGQSAIPGNPDFGDCLVMLYRMGAKRDLSNVVAGFDAGKEVGGGHFAHVSFHITNPDGETPGFYFAFAQI
jgi:hypothetical protein